MTGSGAHGTVKAMSSLPWRGRQWSRSSGTSGKSLGQEVREGHLRQREQHLQRLIVPEYCCQREQPLNPASRHGLCSRLEAASQPGLSGQRRKARGAGSWESDFLPPWPFGGQGMSVLTSHCPRRVADQCASPLAACVFLGHSDRSWGLEQSLFVQKEGLSPGRRPAPAPPVLKSIWVNQGREGGGWPGDGRLGRCILSSQTKTSHRALEASTTSRTVPLPNTHTLRTDHQSPTLRGHDVRNKVFSY